MDKGAMQKVAVFTRPHIPQLVVAWVLMIPLVFFATGGVIRFDAYARNNGMEAAYTQLVSSASQTFVPVRGIVLCICALLLCTVPGKVIRVARNQTIFVALSLLALLSTIWSQFPRESFMEGVYAAICVFFAFYLVARFTPHRQMELFLFLGWIVTVSSIVAALVFPLYGQQHQVAVGAWIGIFVEKNNCSIMVAYLLSVAFYIQAPSPFLRLLRIVYVALSLLLIIMSQARTGWGIAVWLILYVALTKYLSRYKLKDRLLVGLIFLVVGTGTAVISAMNYSSITRLLGKDPSLTGRTSIWTLAFESATKRPFLGYGYRAFWHGLLGESANVSLGARWIVPSAHNGLLDLWLGLGVVGVGLVLYSVIQAVRNAIVCLRGRSSPSAEWYLCIVFLMPVSNLAAATLMLPMSLAWIMYVFACVGLSEEAKHVRRGNGLAVELA